MRFLGPFLLVVVLIVTFLWVMNLSSNSVELKDAKKFENFLKEGRIEKIVRQGENLTCTLGGEKKALTEDGKAYSEFTIFISDRVWAETYIPMVRESGVKWVEKPASKLPDILINIGIFGLVIFLFWFLFFRRLGGGAGGIGLFSKSKAQLIAKGQIKVTFDDVAGIDEAKEEVQEIIHFLREPEKIRKLGGRIPHGVLLIGPPGTGKTLLAKAIAGEAEVPFFSISGSDFVELFVGVGASRVRDLFSQAKANAPCIIFLDEIDAVGRKRGPAHSGGGIEEREQTLNAILVEMQGLTTNENIILISATNRPDMLDPALLRPGRFDRRVYVELPDVKGREEILKIHVRKNSIIIDEDVQLNVIARGTPTFSGAELENLLNEAAIIAARKERDSVKMADLEEARDKVRWGRELKSRTVPEVDKKRTAYHEAGHALVTALVPDLDPLHKVSIIPRGRAMGSTMMLPKNDEFMMSRDKILSIITSLMAGRASELLFLGNVSTGAQNDIEKVTELARRMVCEWGMSDKVGPINFQSSAAVPGFEELGKKREYSEETARLIDDEISIIIKDCSKRCADIIEEHREILVAIAENLIEQETLTASEVGEIIAEEAKKLGMDLGEVNVYIRAEMPSSSESPEKHSDESDTGEQTDAEEDSGEPEGTDEQTDADEDSGEPDETDEPRDRSDS
ncbi:MAG: ATP-dependent zinc metalloprotease FtsH [Planctomycetota bacterium]|nr:ATP-dependent zinc metalloprotease FtsH [Planctomycetota bacterium]